MPDLHDAGALRPPYRVRGFVWTRRWLHRCINLCQATHQALWLGVLGTEGCQALTDYHYNSTRSGLSQDPNYFGEDHNLRGFFAWEQAAVDAHFSACRTLVVGAAGAGREVLAACRRGMQVDAFESNPDLVASGLTRLAAQGAAATLVSARPNEVPESLGTYDGAILGWAAYMHIPGRQRRVAFLTELGRHLHPGGPLLLSFFVYEDSRINRLIYKIARPIRLAFGADPVEPGDSLSTTFDHRFTEPELRAELAASGFEVVFYSERRIGHAVARALPDRRP